MKGNTGFYSKNCCKEFAKLFVEIKHKKETRFSSLSIKRWDLSDQNSSCLSCMLTTSAPASRCDQPNTEMLSNSISVPTTNDTTANFIKFSYSQFLNSATQVLQRPPATCSWDIWVISPRALLSVSTRTQHGWQQIGLWFVRQTVLSFTTSRWEFISTLGVPMQTFQPNHHISESLEHNVCINIYIKVFLIFNI